MVSLLRIPSQNRWLKLAIVLAAVGGPVVHSAHFMGRLMKGDYPVDSDNIAIPIFLHFILFYPFELALLGGLQGLRKGTHLLTWSRARPWRAAFTTLYTIFPVTWWCTAMIWDGLDAKLYATSVFFSFRLYAFLLLRAGMMNRFDGLGSSSTCHATAFGIAMGSNLGGREGNLRRGLDLLLQRIPGARVTAAGALYETDPVDCAPGTQAFINTVVEIEAALTPQGMHAHLQAVEQAMGRPAQREKNAPRTLDLDLLYAGAFVSDDPVLQVPHPRLHLRRFVLQPLADIRPDLILPGHSRTIAQHLAALTDDPHAVRCLGPWAV